MSHDIDHLLKETRSFPPRPEFSAKANIGSMQEYEQMYRQFIDDPETFWGNAAAPQAIRDHVTKQIGALAKPDIIRFTHALPKTRSGKIMRRLLRDIAAGRDITSDVSPLKDKSVLTALKGENSGIRIRFLLSV